MHEEKKIAFSHLCTTMEVKLISVQRGGRGLLGASMLNQYIIS